MEYGKIKNILLAVRNSKGTMMEFTFGIITAGANPEFVLAIINSIRCEQIPNYEIIVVGGCPIQDVIHIPYDETYSAPAQLCVKKNIITKLAKYPRIVYMHDYIALDSGWYQGFLEFGDDWMACMTRIINVDGSRYRDWILDPTIIGMSNLLLDGLLPYDVLDLSYYMYFSGAYWVAKRNLMLEFPLDETLFDTTYGSLNEDTTWSRQINQKYSFSLNTLSSVRLLKYKDPVLSSAQPTTIQHLRTKPLRAPLRLLSGIYK